MCLFVRLFVCLFPPQVSAEIQARAVAEVDEYVKGAEFKSMVEDMKRKERSRMLEQVVFLLLSCRCLLVACSVVCWNRYSCSVWCFMLFFVCHYLLVA